MSINYQWRRLIVSLLDDHLEGLVFDVGDIETIDYYNQVRSLINDLYTANGGIVPIFLEASRTTNQIFPSGVQTPVDFNSGDFDAGNISRVTVNVSGTYIVTVQIWLFGTATTRLDCYLRINGATVFSAAAAVPAGTPRAYSLARAIQLQAGDYCEIVVNPVGGSAQLVVSGVPPILSIASWG